MFGYIVGDMLGQIILMVMLLYIFKFLRVFKYLNILAPVNLHRLTVGACRVISPQYAPVAQLDRAPDFESGGHRFESCRVYHLYCKKFCMFLNLQFTRFHSKQFWRL